MYGLAPQPRSMRHGRPVQVDPLAALLAPLTAGIDAAIPEMPHIFKCDMKETEGDYVLTAEFPGAEKDEVDVKLDDDMLTVSYEHKHEDKEEKEDGKWIIRERSYASMTRSFPLPNADEENTKAELVDGVLTVTVPKKEKSETVKKIEIS